MQTPFVEENCTIEHEGKKFEAGGSWICDCSDGHRRGVVYAKPNKGSEGGYSIGTVTTWHGEFIAIARFGKVYQGAFCKMRTVRFEIGGVKYSGRYCPDWADAVRVRSTKKVAP